MIKHSLSDEDARAAAEDAFKHYGERYAHYHPTVIWESERRARLGFDVKGMHMSGLVELVPGAVEIDLDVPLALRMFKGMAVKIVEGEMRRFLAERERAQAKSAVG